MTLPCAARYAGLGLKLIRRLAREGAFPLYAVSCPHRPRVRRVELDAWITSTRVIPRPTRDATVRDLVSARLEFEQRRDRARSETTP